MNTTNQTALNDISFVSGGFILKGTLHLPPASDPPFVVGAHGLLSDRKSPKQIALAVALNSCGIAFFRFDHRGCGDSEGDFLSVTSLQSRQQDLVDAVEAIASKGETGRFLGLFGSSMGGAACLAATRQLTVPAMVTVAAPVRSRGITTPVEHAAGSQQPTVALNETRLQFDLSGYLHAVRNILIFHGEADRVVLFSNGLEIYENASQPKQLIKLPRGDHRMSDPVHQRTVIEKSTRWFNDALNHL